jgi:ribosome-associated protein
LTIQHASTEAARRAAEFAADRKATDLLCLDIRELSSVADYFVLCTGRSDIHVRAICNRIAEGMEGLGVRLLSSEGVSHGQWALLDFGEVVVHVFQTAARLTYDLERLWASAPRWAYEPADASKHVGG